LLTKVENDGKTAKGHAPMPDRNNTNRVQRRRFPPEPRHSPCQYGWVLAAATRKSSPRESVCCGMSACPRPLQVAPYAQPVHIERLAHGVRPRDYDGTQPVVELADGKSA